MKASHARSTTLKKQNVSNQASHGSIKHYLEYMMANSTAKTMQLDFSSVSQLDSTGLACLVCVYKYLARHNRRMVINNVTGQPLYVMTQLKVSKVIEINPSTVH